MHPFIFASLLTFTISFELYSRDTPHAQEEQHIIDFSQADLSVGKAVDLLNQARAHKITIRETFYYTLGSLVPATILEILGGIGYGLTCPDDGGYEAAKVICGFSITSLSIGSVFLGAGILTPLTILAINYTRENKNKAHNNLLEKLQKLDTGMLLTQEHRDELILLINNN